MKYRMYLPTDNPCADLTAPIGEDCPADPLRVEPLQVLRVVRGLASMDSTDHQEGGEEARRRVQHTFFGGGGALTQRLNVSDAKTSPTDRNLYLHPSNLTDVSVPASTLKICQPCKRLLLNLIPGLVCREGIYIYLFAFKKRNLGFFLGRAVPTTLVSHCKKISGMK